MSHSVERGEVFGSLLPQPKILLGLWCLYPILFPFYLMGKTLAAGGQKFESGVPQMADFYLVAFMGLVFFSLPLRLPRAMVPVVWAVVAFVSYTGIVNVIWATTLEDPSLMTSTLYYAYDCILFVTCLLLYERFKDQFLKVTVYAVVASVLLQVVLSPLAVQQGFSRQALFFNNENQLGYFCLLAALIFVMGDRRFAFPASYRAGFYVAVGYLAVLSQCRGALLALGVLMVVALLERPIRLLLTLGMLTAVFLVIAFEPSLLSKSEERLVKAGEYDTVEARGYDRILNHPEHILFGAGEGAYARFQSALVASEIHSTFGTLLFCYGIIGTGLFSLALLLIAKKDLRSALFLIPAFVYASTHHGLRSAFFWPMLAVLCCMVLRPSSPPIGDTAPQQDVLAPIL